ncbi:metal-dependent hydrolase [Patescibacteria group bacterium]|nr:metal-dependent hydrolase [Patescibacteria group bacterium]MBU2220169.1 metal-dependent hydrolase [Patescibacteria group bacterium]
MTFAHPLIGLILGKEFGYTAAFVIGSLFPDIDHLFILIKNKHFKFREAFAAMKNEDAAGERYKIPYTHSILGWLIFSGVVFLYSQPAGLVFGAAYALHLLLDIIDKDEKQLFYPFKKTIRGFLPVFSKYEIIFSVILLAIYFYI